MGELPRNVLTSILWYLLIIPGLTSSTSLSIHQRSQSLTIKLSFLLECHALSALCSGPITRATPGASAATAQRAWAVEIKRCLETVQMFRSIPWLEHFLQWPWERTTVSCFIKTGMETLSHWLLQPEFVKQQRSTH